MKPDQLADKNLGMTTINDGQIGPLAVAEPPPAQWSNTELHLTVPEQPSVLDLATAYRNQLSKKLDRAVEEVFQAELDVANAQRIAAARRSRVTALTAQLDALEEQIKSLGGA